MDWGARLQLPVSAGHPIAVQTTKVGSKRTGSSPAPAGQHGSVSATGTSSAAAINSAAAAAASSGTPGRSFAGMLRKLANQAGPDKEDDPKAKRTNATPPPEKIPRLSAPTSTLQPPPPPDQLMGRSGFQPYRPDERLAHTSQSPSSAAAACAAAAAFGLDPASYAAAAASYAAATGAPGLFPSSAAALQYRLEEQLYLERMQSMFRTPLYPSLAPPPPSPYAPYYGALGLMPAMHERIKLEEEHRARIAAREEEAAAAREREREREKEKEREREKERQQQQQQQQQQQLQQQMQQLQSQREREERDRLAHIPPSLAHMYGSALGGRMGGLLSHIPPHLLPPLPMGLRPPQSPLVMHGGMHSLSPHPYHPPSSPHLSTRVTSSSRVSQSPVISTYPGQHHISPVPVSIPLSLSQPQYGSSNLTTQHTSQMSLNPLAGLPSISKPSSPTVLSVSSSSSSQAQTSSVPNISHHQSLYTPSQVSTSPMQSRVLNLHSSSNISTNVSLPGNGSNSHNQIYKSNEAMGNNSSNNDHNPISLDLKVPDHTSLMNTNNLTISMSSSVSKLGQTPSSVASNYVKTSEPYKMNSVENNYQTQQTSSVHGLKENVDTPEAKVNLNNTNEMPTSEDVKSDRLMSQEQTVCNDFENKNGSIKTDKIQSAENCGMNVVENISNINEETAQEKPKLQENKVSPADDEAMRAKGIKIENGQ